jgi:uncharacterized protein (DUF4213/DUF364 family)
LGLFFKIQFYKGFNFDFSSYEHRIFLNAYYNALLNYDDSEFIDGDIFSLVDFGNYSDIVMIGYFKTLVEKFDNAGIKLNIFDLTFEELSLPNEKQPEYLQKSDVAIVTATTLFNKTFKNIYENCSGDIFLLGPSCILNNYMFKYKKIKGLFGVHFKKSDPDVIDIIGLNYGTKEFMKLGQKVAINSFFCIYY